MAFGQRWSTTIRGLVINRFGGNGVTISGRGNVIEGCCIGTGPVVWKSTKWRDGIHIESPA